MKRLLSITALSLFLATPVLTTGALAFQCPTDIQAINVALESNTTLSAEERAQVEALRDEGQSLHDSGQHAQSVEVLGQAKEMLGIE